MKLGPALKLRATIARRLGHCTICLHCVHCHGASSLGTSSGTTSAASAAAACKNFKRTKPKSNVNGETSQTEKKKIRRN
ncbi:hypothetical protein Phum_PHUM614420 [Pediculus humanus corporis]|uniref:Uncharacterized protein n=1 Tax=Pediculus humanus subsp. corporis TaxID=121224 RepID=E0W424_PEDHC|nr:uncharacterized protein Phum_PHUM614420 [Pediculus humanus corporis]EEB20380.1 hypothetical protein Phum_PHUM614420 [Pediculus humanus corporis]